jgi:hypothetical protein
MSLYDYASNSEHFKDFKEVFKEVTNVGCFYVDDLKVECTRYFKQEKTTFTHVGEIDHSSCIAAQWILKILQEGWLMLQSFMP